jgi:hypothetical protein
MLSTVEKIIYTKYWGKQIPVYRTKITRIATVNSRHVFVLLSSLTF